MTKINPVQIIALLLFYFSSITCHAAQDGEENSLVRKTRFETATTLTLPEEATVSYFSESRESDLLIKAIMTMPYKVFNDWITGFSLKPEHFEKEKRYHLGPVQDRWDPDSIESMKVAQVNFQNGMVLNIGNAMQTKESMIVYLVFHGK